MTPDRDRSDSWSLSIRAAAGNSLWTDPLWRTIASIDPRVACVTIEGTDFEQSVARLLVLYELKKSGALTYDEFTVLKAKLFGL